MSVSQGASKWLAVKVFVAFKSAILLYKFLDLGVAKSLKVGHFYKKSISTVEEKEFDSEKKRFYFLDICKKRKENYFDQPKKCCLPLSSLSRRLYI